MQIMKYFFFHRSYRKRDRSKERISPYQFDDVEQRSRSRGENLSYQQELERQVNRGPELHIELWWVGVGGQL